MTLIYSLIKKEWRGFFASSMGFLIIGVYLIISGLMLWVVDSSFNIFKYGFGHLSPYFELTPWLLIVLIPAIAMRSIAQERQQGTIDLILTTPISEFQLVIAKYLSIWLLVLTALLPSLIYLVTINKTSSVPEYIDSGSMLSGYCGLVLLTMTLSAIGLFSSSISKQPIVAFIIGIFLGGFWYQGLAVINIVVLDFSSLLEVVNRGVIPYKTLIYMGLTTSFFIFLTVCHIKNFKLVKKHIKPLVFGSIGYVLLVYISTFFSGRADLTDDQRYTLDSASISVIKSIDDYAVIDVFLDNDNFPREFQRLRDETIALLEEISAINGLVSFQLINPLENPETSNQNIQALTQRGLTPMQMEIQEDGQLQRQLIFPWALASLNDQTVKIKLITDDLNNDQRILATESIAQLEWAIVDGLHKLTARKTKNIAILKGNGQLPDLKIADALTGISFYYNLAPFSLDSVETQPEHTLKELQNYDLVISAGPSESFSEAEKFTLDQYLMSGGRMLWFIDFADITIESLLNESGKATALYNDFNLTDFFFSYGIRLKPQLLLDNNSAPLTLVVGEGSNTEFQTFPWPFRPLASNQNQPITSHLAEIKFDFANPIELLKNNISKTILLESSNRSVVAGLPRIIDLNLVSQLDSIPKTGKTYPLGVLLEGEFQSSFKMRLAPFKLSQRRDESKPSKMIVYSDGNLIANDVSRNVPLDLGYDQWTGQRFGNKQLFVNTVSYLLDDFDLVTIRQKTVNLAFLDPEKITNSKNLWQTVNIGIPIAMLLVLAYLNRTYRRHKFGQTVDKFVS